MPSSLDLMYSSNLLPLTSCNIFSNVCNNNKNEKRGSRKGKKGERLAIRREKEIETKLQILKLDMEKIMSRCTLRGREGRFL